MVLGPASRSETVKPRAQKAKARLSEATPTCRSGMGCRTRKERMYVLLSLFVVWSVLLLLCTVSLVRDLHRQRIIEERTFAAHNRPVRARAGVFLFECEQIVGLICVKGRRPDDLPRCARSPRTYAHADLSIVLSGTRA